MIVENLAFGMGSWGVNQSDFRMEIAITLGSGLGNDSGNGLGLIQGMVWEMVYGLVQEII